MSSGETASTSTAVLINTQLYTTVSPDDTDSVDAFFNCILWQIISSSSTKTGILLIGPESQNYKILSP